MEMEPVLPAMPAEPTPSRRTCIPLEQGRLQLEGDGLLCRTCQHHQSILLQLLSAYESPAGMDEEREAAHYQRHRQDLERRYPLCGACRARVQERLRVVEYKVRGRRLATRDKSSQALEVRKKRDAVLWIRTIMLVDVFFVQIAMFGGAWLVDFFDQRIGDWPSQTVLLVLARAAVTLLAGTLAIRDRRNAFKLMCLAILLFFRLVSLNLVADGLLYTRDIRSLPFIVLNVASLALLVQIYQAQRRSVTSPTDSATRIGSSGGGGTLCRNPFSTSSVDLPLTPVMRGSSSGSSIGWDKMVALEKLDPTTPLSTRFTDLSCSLSASPSADRPGSPFAVPPRLSCFERQSVGIASGTKSLAAHSSRSIAPLPPPKPGVFDGTRTSGLESYLEGFSIDESGSRGGLRGRNAGGGGRSTSMDSLVLTAGLLMARIIVEGHLPLTAVLLTLAMALRGSMWPRLHGHIQRVVNVLVLLRLVGLLLAYRPDLVPASLHPYDLTFVAPTVVQSVLSSFQSLEHAIDAAILLSR